MKAELDEEGLAGFFDAEGNLEVLVQKQTPSTTLGVVVP